jgi:tetratricopeptide (TPR) repeat protein
MLYRLVIIVLLLLVDLPVEAATLKGVIMANELSGSPIDNVRVDAVSGTNLTISDLSGKFTLEFPQRKVGDTVRILVKKEGYVVVNDVQLETVLPADADAASLTIILAKEGDREEMARRFYRLETLKVINDTYKAKLKELEEAHQADTTALANLQKERDQAKASAEKLAEEMAKNQPGQSSELYKQAQRVFLNGKIEEAIKLLDDEKLHQLVTEAQKKKAEAEKAIEEAVQDWLLKGQLLTVQFRFEEAEAAYRAAIEAAPDNFSAHFAYASFNRGLNRYQKAEMAYGWCLKWARKGGKDAELADTLNDLGVIDSDQNRMEEARKKLDEALKTYRELAQKNPELYLPDVAKTAVNLGELNRAQNRMEEARKEIATKTGWRRPGRNWTKR